MAALVKKETPPLPAAAAPLVPAPAMANLADLKITEALMKDSAFDMRDALALTLLGCQFAVAVDNVRELQHQNVCVLMAEPSDAKQAMILRHLRLEGINAIAVPKLGMRGAARAKVSLKDLHDKDLTGIYRRVDELMQRANDGATKEHEAEDDTVAKVCTRYGGDHLYLAPWSYQTVSATEAEKNAWVKATMMPEADADEQDEEPEADSGDDGSAPASDHEDKGDQPSAAAASASGRQAKLAAKSSAMHAKLDETFKTMMAAMKEATVREGMYCLEPGQIVAEYKERQVKHTLTDLRGASVYATFVRRTTGLWVEIRTTTESAPAGGDVRVGKWTTRDNAQYLNAVTVPEEWAMRLLSTPCLLAAKVDEANGLHIFSVKPPRVNVRLIQASAQAELDKAVTAATTLDRAARAAKIVDMGDFNDGGASRILDILSTPGTTAALAHTMEYVIRTLGARGCNLTTEAIFSIEMSICTGRTIGLTTPESIAAAVRVLSGPLGIPAGTLKTYLDFRVGFAIGTDMCPLGIEVKADTNGVFNVPWYSAKATSAGKAVCSIDTRKQQMAAKDAVALRLGLMHWGRFIAAWATTTGETKMEGLTVAGKMTALNPIFRALRLNSSQFLRTLVGPRTVPWSVGVMNFVMPNLIGYAMYGLIMVPTVRLPRTARDKPTLGNTPAVMPSVITGRINTIVKGGGITMDKYTAVATLLVEGVTPYILSAKKAAIDAGIDSPFARDQLAAIEPPSMASSLAKAVGVG